MSEEIGSFMLEKVIDDGKQISLINGSLWNINPGDIPTVCTWLPTAEINIIKENNPIYPYILVNKEINVKVKADQIG